MRLTLTSFLTIDGVAQSPGRPDEDPSDGFEHGGWQYPFVDGDAMQLEAQRLEAAGALLLGRRTYEIFAAHWPRVTDPADRIARRLNELPKYVVSRTLDSVTWQGARLVAGDLAEEVVRLKAQPGGELQVSGSTRLARSLVELDLVDEYRLWIHPVLLGTGERLFERTPARALQLVATTTTSTGVVVATYRPAGGVGYGSSALDAEPRVGPGGLGSGGVGHRVGP